MTESERFLDTISELEQIADAVAIEDALDSFDAATLQVFWRTWPNVSGWAGGLWRRLNEEIEAPARPVGDADIDEVGEAG